MTKISTITAGKTNRKRLGCPHLMLELAGPFDVDAFGQLHLLGDHALGLIDEADDVAAADVEGDVVQQPAVLALDHGRAFDDPHVGHGAQAESAACPDRVAGRGRMARLARDGSSDACRIELRADAMRRPGRPAPSPAPAMPPGLTSSRRMLSSSSRQPRA